MQHPLAHSALALRRRVRKRLQYFVMRNAVPLTKREREISRNSARIFANSIPKSGTNLLSRLLRLLPNTVSNWTYHIDETMPSSLRQISTGKRGQIITAHLPWSVELSGQLARLDFRNILIVRDMRDVAVSGAYYVTHMDHSHPLHEYFNALASEDDQLLAMIEGVGPEFYPDGKMPDSWHNDSYRGFLPWLDDPACVVVRFEDLIGGEGGGDTGLQADTIRKVAAHVGAELDDARLDDIVSQLFSTSSRTFRKGQIGDWKNRFNDVHKAAFKKKSGEMLIRLGYENSDGW